MGRYTSVLAAFLLSCAALAAPAPKPFESGWGIPTDPDRNCKIRRDGASLIFELPGSDHDYDPIRKRFNAPRLLREMEGEFEIQVRVQIECRPSNQSTVEDQPSSVSAGFLLIFPEPARSVCSRIEFGILQPGVGLGSFAFAPRLPSVQVEGKRIGIGQDGYVATKAFFSKNTNFQNKWDRDNLQQLYAIFDRGWQNWPLAKKTDHAYLKLNYLRGGGFHYFFSPDGEKWTDRGSELGGMPTKLQLGLAAYSTSSEPSKVRFDQLKLWRGKKKE